MIKHELTIRSNKANDLCYLKFTIQAAGTKAEIQFAITCTCTRD